MPKFASKHWPLVFIWAETEINETLLKGKNDFSLLKRKLLKCTQFEQLSSRQKMSGRESVDRQNKADGIKVGQKATPSFGLMK